jgi:glutamate N-acetyltransferase/amino-acid N-acetyltransferase
MVCSTGRIGVPLPIGKMATAIAKLPEALKSNGSRRAAEAIMTSDTFAKEIAVEFELDGKPVRIGGIAKGAGMIDPNMATMLCFISTDAAIEKKQLQEALSASVEQSFNRITVDGDMSTNDTVIMLANGVAGNKPLRQGAAGLKTFQRALDHVTRNLARMIVEDGEGVTKFVEVHVNGAANLADARKAAEAVANSTLTKCAWFGGDPNWGRILGALGYSAARVVEEKIDVAYSAPGSKKLTYGLRKGAPTNVPFVTLCKCVAEKEFDLHIFLNLGLHNAVLYTSDLTEEYVEFNKGDVTDPSSLGG